MNVITHRTDKYNEIEVLSEIKNRVLLKSNGEEALILFNQLCEFEFGRWLLINRGLNHYWSYYLIYYHECYTNREFKLHPLESIMIEKAPGVLAARERYTVNLKILQDLVRNNMTVASIPCGLMNDLLRLDLKKVKNMKLIGIDLDPEAIENAKKNSVKLNKESMCSFRVADAWNLEIEHEFDLITSAGLAMYVQTEENLIKLYKNFYKALKPNGVLVLSNNMPPFDENGNSYWNVNQTELDYVHLQAMIYNDVINVRQGLFCTEMQIIGQLKTVGFKDISINHDARKMFVAFIAYK